MRPRSFFNEDYLLWEALLLSFGLHFLFLHAGQFTLRLKPKHPVEIDITNMGHLGMPAVPKRAAAPAALKPAVQPQAWIQPKPGQKAAPAPVPTQPVPAPPSEEPLAPAEYNIGTGDGSPSALSRLPQLLNLSDLAAILKRFYPEEARSQSRESTVVLDLHIDGEGHVANADIVQSGGADFDDAAQRVVKLLRFTPAFLGSQRVAVKMRQAIRFKLE